MLTRYLSLYCCNISPEPILSLIFIYSPIFNIIEIKRTQDLIDQHVTCKIILRADLIMALKGIINWSISEYIAARTVDFLKKVAILRRVNSEISNLQTFKLFVTHIFFNSISQNRIQMAGNSSYPCFPKEGYLFSRSYANFGQRTGKAKHVMRVQF